MAQNENTPSRGTTADSVRATPADSVRSTSVQLAPATGGLVMTFRPTPLAPLPKSLGTGVPKSADDVATILGERLGSSVVKTVMKSLPGDHSIVVEGEKIVDVMKVLRDDDRLQCVHMLCISATDFLGKAGTPATETAPAVEADPARMEIVYHLSSFVHRHIVVVKVLLDRENARLPSVSDLFRAANWYERECYDMLGVQFTGHPFLERLLLPNDWVGHPLRRDYVFPEEYNGMKVPL